MGVLDLIVLIVGVGIFISILVYFIIIEIKASVFPRLGFEEETSFDFDYTQISGIDSNEEE